MTESKASRLLTILLSALLLSNCGLQVDPPITDKVEPTGAKDRKGPHGYGLPPTHGPKALTDSFAPFRWACQQQLKHDSRYTQKCALFAQLDICVQKHGEDCPERERLRAGLNELLSQKQEKESNE